MTNFEQFKNREFLGDKLLDLIISDILLSRGENRNEVNRILPTYTTTNFLNILFDKLNIEEHKFDKSDREIKRRANAVEEYLFDCFIKDGYNSIKEIINTQLSEIKIVNSSDYGLFNNDFIIKTE